jgi:uncharacterized repeat protein (TIGR01451 family)
MERGNRPRRFALGVLLSAVFALALAGAAQAVVLYEQMAPLEEPASSITSNDFTPASTGQDTQAADDFTVPAGQTWTITLVEVIGAYSTIPPGTTNVHVFIYANDPDPDPVFDVPLDPPLFQQLNSATTGAPNYAVALSGAPTLGPGKYWISIQQAGAFEDDNQGVFQAWSWRALEIADPAIGSQFAVKNPDNLCVVWTSGPCQDRSDQNLAFRLHAADANADLAIDKRTKADVVRPGSVVPYTIEVSNPGVADALDVRVCDKLPPDHNVLRAKGASVKKKRKVCWDLDSLAAGADRVFKVTTQVSLNPRQQRQRNVAVASADNVEDRPQDDAVVRLRGVPDTCARSLAAPIQPRPYC